MFAEINKEMMDALPFVLCTLGENGRQGNIDRPEGFPFHQFIWLKGGEGDFLTEGERFHLGAGMGMFFPANLPHWYRGTGDGMSTIWATFRGCESVLAYYQITGAFQFQVPELLATATAELSVVCEGESTLVSRSAAGYLWLTRLLEELFAPAAPIAQQVRQFLEANYGKPLSLGEIAEAVHMEKFSLCHYYAKEHGTTVIAELTAIRIAKAKQFLRYSSKNVEEIGRLCGFESPSYFGKRFREETGTSPKEYRRLHNK